MNLRIDQQNLPHLNNREKTDSIEKKMKRVSGICGTITKELTFIELKPQEDEKGTEKVFKEIMAESFSNLSRDTDLLCHVAE